MGGNIEPARRPTFRWESPIRTNNVEWDNLPAQRCFWYQVQKVCRPSPDPYIDATVTYRSMVVYVNQSLQSRTVFSGRLRRWCSTRP